MTEAVWNPEGASVYLRYAKAGDAAITTYYGTFAPSATSSPDTLADLTGGFLPQGISSITANGASAFSILAGSSGSASGVLSNPDGTKAHGIWSSPLSEWTQSFVNSSLIALQTKASADAPGFLYFLNPKTQGLSLRLSNLYGLSATVSPDGTRAAYSAFGIDGKFGLNLFNVQTGESSPLSLTTLAEKCAWSAREKSALYCAIPQNAPSAEYPDDWYQGKISFSDEFWKIDTATGVTRQVIGIADLAGSIDAINLSLSPNEDYLIFTNKADSLLWGIKL